MQLSGHGLTANLPDRWDGRIFALPDTGPVMHLGNFAVPADDNGFGAAATAAMRPGHVFVAVVEYIGLTPGPPGTAYSAQGVPRLSLGASSFQDRLQQGALKLGRAGLQRSFSVGSRCFLLYALLYRLPGVDQSAMAECENVIHSLSVDPSHQHVLQRRL